MMGKIYEVRLFMSVIDSKAAVATSMGYYRRFLREPRAFAYFEKPPVWTAL
jgi:hypothetical protein